MRAADRGVVRIPGRIPIFQLSFLALALHVFPFTRVVLAVQNTNLQRARSISMPERLLPSSQIFHLKKAGYLIWRSQFQESVYASIIMVHQFLYMFVELNSLLLFSHFEHTKDGGRPRGENLIFVLRHSSSSHLKAHVARRLCRLVLLEAYYSIARASETHLLPSPLVPS